MRSWFAIAAVALLVAGCPNKRAAAPDPGPDPAVDAPPAGELPDDLAAMIERAIGLMEALATAAEGAEADCAAMTANVSAVADGSEGGAILAVDAHPAWETSVDAVTERFGPRLDAAIGRLIAATEPCAEDPGLGAALVKVGLGE
jgi:hypothetical protein